MKTFIEKLLAKNIIAPLTTEYSGDFDWFDDTLEQYFVIDFDCMISYCNDDGYITDLVGFSKDGDTWFGVTFDESMITLENVIDGLIYSNMCNIQLWRKESL
jgi:hypothetical protein